MSNTDLEVEVDEDSWVAVFACRWTERWQNVHSLFSMNLFSSNWEIRRLQEVEEEETRKADNFELVSSWTFFDEDKLGDVEDGESLSSYMMIVGNEIKRGVGKNGENVNQMKEWKNEKGKTNTKIWFWKTEVKRLKAIKLWNWS